jgi:hypothetical protein
MLMALEAIWQRERLYRGDAVIVFDQHILDQKLLMVAIQFAHLLLRVDEQQFLVCFRGDICH